MEYANRLIRDTETAAILGCSRATVWAMVKAGKIPAPLKIGSMARWRIADIETMIDLASDARDAPALHVRRKGRGETTVIASPIPVRVRTRSRLNMSA